MLEYIAILFPALVTIMSFVGIITDEGIVVKNAPVPVWVCWCTLLVGSAGCVICLHSIKKERKRVGQRDLGIDAEYAKAKESMDEWFLEEFGERPDHEEGRKYAEEWYVRAYHKKPGEVKRDEKKNGE